MNIPKIENVISSIQGHLGVTLYKEQNKQIFYRGKQISGIEILVCAPQSKLHSKGCGWIDLTTVQVSMLDEADYPILAFRLEGNKVYYLDFCVLKPYLTREAMVNNEREGDHWKLYVWPTEIQVLGNSKRLQNIPNDIENLKHGQSN